MKGDVGRLSYLIIICPLTQNMRKSILVVFSDTQVDDCLDTILEDYELTCSNVLCTPDVDEVILDISLSEYLPKIIEAVKI